MAANVRVQLAFVVKDKVMNNETADHPDARQFPDEHDAIPDDARHIDDALDEALDESFPASDPIAVTIAKLPRRSVISMRWIEANRLVKADSRLNERQGEI